VTGEHGVGVLKRRHLEAELGPDLMGLNHAVKRALDPDGLLNPGKAI
jgi:glycolate oxidase